VKKALNERQNLLTIAPHLVKPQPFVLPYQKHMRAAWLLRLGLFFYDHLSRKNRLPKCRFVFKSPKNPYFKPLLDEFKRGFLFYDAATDDARLTVVNALQAKNNAASIRTHTKVVHAEVVDQIWKLTVEPKQGEPYFIYAKALINASGPWVNAIADMTQIPNQQKMTLVKGSHIVVPKLYEGQHAYFLQHEDKRVIFVIPYQGFSMIGTTDIAFTGSPDEVHISEEEIDYLTGLVNCYFKTKLSKDDIVSTWSGIRPLLAEDGKDMKSISRDYNFEFSMQPAPIITIYGGKITTYRQLAEDVINQLQVLFPHLAVSTTQHAPLPGAEFKGMNFIDYTEYARKHYDWLEPELLNRYLFSYGTQMEHFLSSCKSMADLGKNFGDSLYQAEVDYLLKEEWARDEDDILKRRTKLGFSFAESEREELREYLRNFMNTDSLLP
ncbi:MAG: glycerol-3-phosphate dehydrogenase, partial [Legionella sp.]